MAEVNSDAADPRRGRAEVVRGMPWGRYIGHHHHQIGRAGECARSGEEQKGPGRGSLHQASRRWHMGE